MAVRTPFVWRDPATNASVIADVHPGAGPDPDGTPGRSYYSRDGVLCDCVGAPGLDEVLCYAFRGDNYGPASVAETLARMRAMMRHRSACPGLAAFTRLLLKLPEHTWGGSYSGHMRVTLPDRDYGNAAFDRARAAGSDAVYAVAEATWDEQRAYVDAAVGALDDARPSALAQGVRREFAALGAPVDPAAA
eukprot:gene47066-2218_t